MEEMITKVFEHIKSKPNSKIILLNNREVISWLFGDTSFLATNNKENEDVWGREVLKLKRPDLKLDKQWTNKFGEHICEELYTLLGFDIKKPIIKEHYQPDLEIDDAIIEVKTGTYYTSGTAHEKILGCAFKYAEVPELYNKPLKIICIGGAEKLSKERYGILEGTSCSPKKKMYIDFFKENKIEYEGITSILQSMIPDES
jgi:hypothetical protein